MPLALQRPVQQAAAWAAVHAPPLAMHASHVPKRVPLQWRVQQSVSAAHVLPSGAHASHLPVAKQVPVQQSEGSRHVPPVAMHPGRGDAHAPAEQLSLQQCAAEVQGLPSNAHDAHSSELQALAQHMEAHWATGSHGAASPPVVPVSPPTMIPVSCGPVSRVEGASTAASPVGASAPASTPASPSPPGFPSAPIPESPTVASAGQVAPGVHGPS